MYKYNVYTHSNDPKISPHLSPFAGSLQFAYPVTKVRDKKNPASPRRGPAGGSANNFESILFVINMLCNKKLGERSDSTILLKNARNFNPCQQAWILIVGVVISKCMVIDNVPVILICKVAKP